MSGDTSKRGVTLVEILIVIAVIAMLFQLMIPAIESSREGAREVSCANNLRQIALAAQLHHDSQRHFPSGGWITQWVGDPLRGFAENQPGGWIYNVLPYLEAGAIHDLPDDGDPKRISEDQLKAAAGMIQLPLPVFQCPSRRLPRAYPYILTDHIWDTVNSNMTDKVARSDYAANGGDSLDEAFPFFTIIKDVDSTDYDSIDKGIAWASTDRMNGVCFVRSVTSSSRIIDGLSKTYLIGEKYLSIEHYKDGMDAGDNHSMYQGFDRDIIRWAGPTYKPLPDSSRKTTSESFGSAHPTFFHMSFCDGSVQRINYDIDLEVHRTSSNIYDGR